MSSSPPLRRHARTPALPTTASACLHRPRACLLLVRGSSGAAAATLLVATAAPSSPDLACSHYSCVAASPSPRASSASSRRAVGGLGALAVTASAVAVFVCWIFFLAIRSMLTCKREAEFLEKYFDSARERVPKTMASVRLVGREVGDLAVDLADLIQELTTGAKGSMSIVHKAEAQLRQPTPSPLLGTPHRIANQKKVVEEPLLASTVRDLRELIADIRSGYGAASGIASLFMWASNFGPKRRKNRS